MNKKTLTGNTRSSNNLMMKKKLESKMDLKGFRKHDNSMQLSNATYTQSTNVFSAANNRVKNQMTKSQEFNKKSVLTSDRIFMLNNTFNSSFGPEIDKSVHKAKSLKMMDAAQRRSVDDGPNPYTLRGKINLYNYSAKKTTSIK